MATRLDDVVEEKYLPQDLIEMSAYNNEWGSILSAASLRIYTSVGLKVDGVITSTAREGYLMFGPYVSLVEGNWVASISLEMGGGSATVDVVAERGEHVLFKKDYTGKIKNLRLPFVVESQLNDVEVRIRVDNMADMVVESIHIFRDHRD